MRRTFVVANRRLATEAPCARNIRAGDSRILNQGPDLFLPLVKVALDVDNWCAHVVLPSSKVTEYFGVKTAY